ncbi:MAG: sulfatase-like hydrolase/transferase [Opitutales bacterium]
MKIPLPLLSCVALTLSTQGSVVIDFTNRADSSGTGPWTLPINNTNTSPSYGSISGGASPGISGTFTAATSDSFTVTLQGLHTDFDPSDFTSGTPSQIIANSSGAGIQGGTSTSNGIEGGEGIIFTFGDLSGLSGANAIILENVNLNSGGNIAIYRNETLLGSSDNFESLIISPDDQIAVTKVSGGANVRLTNIVFDIVELGNASTPTNLAPNTGFNQVGLDWDDDPSANFNYFNVYRSTSSPVSTADTLLDTTTTSDYIDTDVTNGTTYYYAVSAVGTNLVETSLSNEVFATPDTPSPIQDLDASDPANVIGADLVTQWTDLSGNGNHALEERNRVWYPSESLMQSGGPGLDFRSRRTSLELFNALASESWLDQSSSADGFAIFIAFKCEDLLEGQFSDILGNSTDGTNGIQFGYTHAGDLQVRLGSTVLSSSTPNTVQPGDTVIAAINYNPDTSTLELWDSKSLATSSASVSPANFATNRSVELGSIDVAGQYFNGIVGGIQIYDTFLELEPFEAIKNTFMYDWRRPPNIILFFVDDMPWYDTPVTMDERMPHSKRDELQSLQINGEPYYWNFQRLADEGTLFMNAYSSAPQCTPTRASLQTGQSTARNRVGVTTSVTTRHVQSGSKTKYPVLENGARIPFDENVTTIPEVMAPIGYQCAHYGKWHLYSHPSVEGYVESDGETTNSAGSPNDPDNPKQIYGMTNRTINFIDTQHDAKRPFYIQLSHYAVHRGFQSLDESKALFSEYPNNSTYLGMIYDLDRSLGLLMEHLESLGIYDNTYIIFTADNGDRSFNKDDFKQPLYGDKWMLWQLGIRVPLIIKGPGVQSGRVSPFNTVTYDFLPTYYEWAGGNADDLENMDGISLKGLLEGVAPSEEMVNRSLYFHYPHYRNSMPMSAVVKGKYKLLRAWDGEIRDDAYKMTDRDMLFDLSIDPGEFHNLNNTTPELTAKADSLSQDMDNYFTSIDAWVPQDNATAYQEDPDDVYESEIHRSHRWYPIFEGTRGPNPNHNQGLNDLDASPYTQWFGVWGADIGDSSNDFDLDGLSNLMEYALGTSPVEPNSEIGQLLPGMQSNGIASEFIYTLHHNPGEIDYQAQFKANLEDPWQVIESTPAYSGSILDDYFSSPPAGEQGFFRLEVSERP